MSREKFTSVSLVEFYVLPSTIGRQIFTKISEVNRKSCLSFEKMFWIFRYVLDRGGGGEEIDEQ